MLRCLLWVHLRPLSTLPSQGPLSGVKRPVKRLKIYILNGAKRPQADIEKPRHEGGVVGFKNIWTELSRILKASGNAEVIIV